MSALGQKQTCAAQPIRLTLRGSRTRLAYSMFAMGQKQTFRGAIAMSALLPKADMCDATRVKSGRWLAIPIMVGGPTLPHLPSIFYLVVRSRTRKD